MKRPVLLAITVALTLVSLFSYSTTPAAAQVDAFCKQTPDPDYNVRVRDAELCLISRAAEFSKDNMTLRVEIAELQTRTKQQMRQITDLKKELATTIATTNAEKASLLQQLANSQTAFFQSRSELASVYESVAVENENIIVALGVFMVVAAIITISGLSRKKKMVPSPTSLTQTPDTKEGPEGQPRHTEAQTNPADHANSLEKEVLHLTTRVTELSNQTQEARHQGMRLAIKGGKGVIKDEEDPSGVAYEFDAICCPGGEKHPKHGGMAVVKVKNIRDHFAGKTLPASSPNTPLEQAKTEVATATA